jgi:hypothetical protein
VRGDPNVYRVRITMTEEYEAWVVAPDGESARRCAREGRYEDVWATGHILRRTVHEAKLMRDMTPDDVVYG